MAVMRAQAGCYYGVLGVHRKAAPEEVRAAYRRLALRHHPDKHPPESRAANETVFKQVAEAYCVLSDPAARALYNATGRRGGGRGARASRTHADEEEARWDAFEVFEQMLGRGFFAQHAAQEQRERALEAARELEAEGGVLPPPLSRGSRRRARNEQKAARREGVHRMGVDKKALKKQRKADRDTFAKLHKKAAKKRQKGLGGGLDGVA